ncbi:MAG: hypothetical protein IKZ96_03210 [Bacilli bacterium]|nr:hypothetical protein [Bacilli bacterium]
MKLRDYRFESKEDLNSVACCVLTYFCKDINAKDVDYSSISEYKVKQLNKLTGDNYDITPENLMMYLSCPVGVEDVNDISTFGIRTSGELPNGRINMHLSKMILCRALLENASLDTYEKIVDSEDVGTDRLQLPDTSDYLDCYVSSLLREPELLYYLFFTGRGEEFTRLFADSEFLKKLEDGSFKPNEIFSRLSPYRSAIKETPQLLKDFAKEDELRIKSLTGETPAIDANKLVR